MINDSQKSILNDLCLEYFRIHLGPRVSIDSFYMSICFTSTKRWSIDIRNTTIILDLKLKRHAPNCSRNYVDKHVG